MRSLTAALLLLASFGVQAQVPESFTLESLEGVSYTLPDEQHGVGIYLFWASWCPYCKALMPHIQSILDEYGDHITVYALNFRDRNDPAELIAENGYGFVVFPDAGDVAASWGVHGTPGLFIIDESRTVRLNLYDVIADNPPGYDALSHAQKAARRAPFWAARIRETLDEVIGSGR
ncbi:MAG: TlpA family protein disulfide reductase [Pseudomonadota bacterium]|nr:MAG: TlpA family protein disulfide reductase [Pseudomonadota bacterium]